MNSANLKELLINSILFRHENMKDKNNRSKS